MIWVYGLRVQSITTTTPCHQELEAADDSVSAVREQRERDAGTQLAFVFSFRPKPQPMEWCHAHKVWLIPP